jgi:hypothetical protein
MPIEELVGNTELLKRVLEHYRSRLENFTNDAEIKPLLSEPVRQHLTFGHLKSSIIYALDELAKGADTTKLKSPPYSDLVISAARQYLKDLEQIKEKTGRDLPDVKLEELESDIEITKACLK